MDKPRILVVDDEAIIRQLLERTLTKNGYLVETAEDGQVALDKFQKTPFNLIMTDLKMPKVEGLGILREIKKFNPHVEVIIITGFPTIESAVQAIKIGAFDFICKPFDIQQVLEVVSKCLEKQKFQTHHIALNEVATFLKLNEIIVSSKDINAVIERILDGALEITKAKRGSLMILDEEKGELVIGAARGLDEEIVKNCRVKLGEGIAGSVAQNKEGIFTINAREYCQAQGGSGADYETNSFLSIPLISSSVYGQERVLGVINLSDKISGENFTERESNILSVLAGQAAIAIENARLYLQLQNNINTLRKTIEELNETQDQLIQTEKLAAVGQLAFGIAHEIRNPLGVILGGIEFLDSSIPKDGTDVQESINIIKNSVTRANKIIIELLKFSRASKLELHSINVAETITGALELITGHAKSKDIKIQTVLPDEKIFIRADETMFRQIIFNLSINGIDAMDRSGKLTIKFYREQASPDKKKEADWSIVEVIDTGCGISEENMRHIFNPFFTTKGPNKGTGLGLSIVHLIVEKLGGTIKVESKLQAGTKFILRLPIINSN
ncbi:MAG: response regulator [Candidatus Omnitrophota bacterium]